MTRHQMGPLRYGVPISTGSVPATRYVLPKDVRWDVAPSFLIVRLAGSELDANFGVSLKGRTTAELTEGDCRYYVLGSPAKAG